MHSKTGYVIFFSLIILVVIIPFSIAGTKIKSVEGYVLLPNGSPANNASVRVHVIASAGIGASIPCITDPQVFTDSTGYYITNLANLKRDSNGADCGDNWYSGDTLWAVANGSTVIPAAYTSSNSSNNTIPDNSGATMTVSNVTLLNSLPEITSVSASPSPINGGNQTTITPSGQTDENHDDISLLCCFDTSDSCTPAVANNECGGSWENVSYSYTGMNCTWTSPYNIDDTYYSRCRIKDQQNFSGVVSTSFIVDGLAPASSDNFASNNTWTSSNQAITITQNCSLVSCNWTYYCTENETCTPHINYSSSLTFSDENLSYLRYHSQDILGKTQDITSYLIKIDKGAPLKTNAAVTIENGSVYAASTTLNLNWSGFSDNLSGINGYYYSFTNNEGTSSGTSDAGSPGQLSGASQGEVNIFIWANDTAGNIGLSVNDSIIVDSLAPSAGIYNISEDTGGNYLHYNRSEWSLCYSDNNAGFTIQVNASDATSGLNNATGDAFFGDSPTDNTPITGNYQFELAYTVETPVPGSDIINITVYDNVSNNIKINLTATKDASAPGSVAVTDNFNGWNSNENISFTWNKPDDLCGIREYFWNIDNSTNTTTSSRYANTTNNAAGNHTIYVYATDVVDNTGLIGSHDFWIDTSAPSTPSNLQDQQEFDNDGSFTLAWGSVADISGITYEVFENDNQSEWVSIQNTTSTTLNINGRLNGHNYTYFVRSINGAGLLSGNSTKTDGLLVDTSPPFIKNAVNDDINQTSSGSMTVNATMGDTVSGFNATPTIEYRYGNDSWSSEFNMTKLAGDEYEGNYTYEIPEPGSGWLSYRGQQAYWNITVNDKTGNINETQYSTTVTSINLLTFNVQDRILGSFLADVNITGGTACPSGCIFNNSKNISEVNGNYTFTIRKTGFSTNETNISIETQDLTLNVTLNDTQAPSVTFVNYSVVVVSNSTFNATVYANISDNLKLDRLFLNFTISGFFSDSGQANFSLVSGSLYLASVGPYNQSFYMASNIFVNDSYNLQNSSSLDNVWYVFANGTTSTTVSYGADDEILVLKQGWNLLSVPFVSNHTVEAVLEGLSNGNWGCGRDTKIPITCNESAGDYAGNFTKVMGYNLSGSTWLTFNPTDLYTAIADESLESIDAKRGYWINMTQDQNLTLDLKFN